MKFIKYFILVISFFLLSLSSSFSQEKKNENKDEKGLSESTISGLKFRSIGPAFTSGRIADFAVNCKNPSEYYVAVASGHIWKTVNNGITFKPVFDKYGAYSIGCIKMDPNNHNIVWAGTGENNHQRALGYGNGVYKTMDGGKTWKNTGLKESRQIGMIAIDPRNTDIVFVAAEGSLWGPGGDRGLFKTSDGGKNWKKVLEISKNTGVNNVIIDPDDPNIMYATSEQRRRHVHTKIGGGPESALYKSTDGGNTWRKITKGLPKVDMGGIGIDVSPVNTNVVYLIIEAAEGKGGFFKSVDKGESWNKMSDHSSSGQYYNEIYCDPVDVDKVYSVETFSHYTEDGGKTWKQLGLEKRHVDDHAMWINPNNPDHFIIGGDGGVYLTYDTGKNYRQISNLPVTQFYRVYVDNAKPFYNVYGGTQDNASYGGPSQNISEDGVTTADWTVTLFGDGFWGAVDPSDPNIVYSEYQYGNVYRYDKKSGEKLKIKPMPAKDEKSYRWNWNAPFIMSPHNNQRLYIAANKVFRSNDRGNSWQTISKDLTAQIDRNSWKVMDKYWSFDAVVKDVSSSLFGTVVSIDESPVKENLIYIGTDDGLIQITEDAGATWRKAGTFPGVPEYTYVSDVFADRFDENIVYACFENLKRDDFKPYILKSANKGKTWKSISNNLPVNGTVHTIQQDHVNSDLLFAGTEFGFFFSVNGGAEWIQIKSGIPDVAVKDIVIQKRENDLVLATFGRGFYILDDYSSLRLLDDNFIETNEAFIFPVKDALLYMQTNAKYGQGSTVYYAKNADYGACFTYYLKDAPKSTKEIRLKKEKELFKNADKISQPTWKDVEDENKEELSYLLFIITDDEGNVIRKLTKKPSKGINRISWDLRFENSYPVQSEGKKFDPFKSRRGGIPVSIGKYKISMALYDKGEYKKLTDPITFNVKKLNNTSLPADDQKIVSAYLKDLNETVRVAMGTYNYTKELKKKILIIKQTVITHSETSNELIKKVQNTENDINEILFVFEGIQPKASYEEIPPHLLPIQHRLRNISWGRASSTSNITETEKEQLKIIKDELPELIERLKKIVNTSIPEIEKQLNEINAPWTPGRIIDIKK